MSKRTGNRTGREAKRRRRRHERRVVLAAAREERARAERVRYWQNLPRPQHNHPASAAVPDERAPGCCPAPGCPLYVEVAQYHDPQPIRSFAEAMANPILSVPIKRLRSEEWAEGGTNRRWWKYAEF